ncbi:hypothetical protein ACMFMF_002588 [Clarireedia jacksonii]
MDRFPANTWCCHFSFSPYVFLLSDTHIRWSEGVFGFRGGEIIQRVSEREQGTVCLFSKVFGPRQGVIWMDGFLKESGRGGWKSERVSHRTTICKKIVGTSFFLGRVNGWAARN